MSYQVLTSTILPDFKARYEARGMVSVPLFLPQDTHGQWSLVLDVT